MAIEKTVNINVKEKGLDSVNKKVKDLDESIGEVKGQGNFLSGATDGVSKLSPAIGGAISGMKAMIVQMWAIVANPIGLVVAAIVLGLTALYKAFTSTNAGADKMKQLMKGLSATIDVVRDRVLKVGEALVKFFSGDFKGAMADGKAAVSGFGAEVEREFKQAADATRLLQEVEDAVRSLGVSRAKLNRDLARSKEIITDETASYADKKKAIEEVRLAEEKQTASELANAKKKLASIIALNKQSDTSDEDLQKAADAQAAVFALEEKSASDRRAIRKTELRADNEEKSRLKGISDIAKAKAKEISDEAKKKLEDAKKTAEELVKAEAKTEEERQKKLLEIQKSYTLKIEDLDDITNTQKAERQKARALAELEELKATEEEKLNLKLYYDAILLEAKSNDKKAQDALDKAAKEEQKKIDDAILEQKKELKQAEQNLLYQGLSVAKDIFAKNKAVQKGIIIVENALALASLVKSTIKSVGKDNEASPLTLGMPWSGIHIAQGVLGATQIISSTSKALQAVGGGSAGSAPSISGGGGSAPAPPQFNIVGQNTNNQLAQSIGRQQSLPIEAYVVSGAVTTAQAMDRNRVKTATFN